MQGKWLQTMGSGVLSVCVCVRTGVPSMLSHGGPHDAL